MPDTPSEDRVLSAFDALMAALAAEAMASKKKFERAAAFRTAVERLAERWADGVPPHTVKKAKAADAPAAEPAIAAQGEG